jgi:hypothetical protein
MALLTAFFSSAFGLWFLFPVLPIHDHGFEVKTALKATCDDLMNAMSKNGYEE